MGNFIIVPQLFRSTVFLQNVAFWYNFVILETANKPCQGVVLCPFPYCGAPFWNIGCKKGARKWIMYLAIGFFMVFLKWWLLPLVVTGEDFLEGKGNLRRFSGTLLLIRSNRSIDNKIK